MIDPMDVTSLVTAVKEFYPRHKLSEKRAAAILDKSFRGVSVFKIAEFLGHFAGARPEDKEPPWSEITARMVSQRLLVAPGHSKEGAFNKSVRETAEWRAKHQAAVDELNAVPEDKWPVVCEAARGMAMVPGSDIPKDWFNKGFWVQVMLLAWHRLKGVAEPAEARGEMPW